MRVFYQWKDFFYDKKRRDMQYDAQTNKDYADNNICSQFVMPANKIFYVY